MDGKENPVESLTVEEAANITGWSVSDVSPTRRSGRVSRPPAILAHAPEPPSRLVRASRGRRATARLPRLPPATVTAPFPAEAAETDLAAKPGEVAAPAPRQSRRRKASKAKDADSATNGEGEVEVGDNAGPSKKRRNSASTRRPRTSTQRKAKAAAPGASVVEVVKPKCIGEPPVWAEGRQALCETLPYYRAYQSAAYTHGGLCHGMLFDRFGGPRDYIDDEIIISRAGGGRGRDEDGEMKQTEDQCLTTRGPAAMKRNLDQGVPFVAIAGIGNPSLPSRIPHRYCVLDWFIVTHIWAEKVDDKVMFQVRCQKLDLAAQGWWAAEGAAPRAHEPDYTARAPLQRCSVCGDEHPRIYNEAWTCLSSTCTAFWTDEGRPLPASLTYSQAFLQERIPREVVQQPPFPLTPPLLESSGDNTGLSYSREAWKGVVCPKCRRCNSRYLWTGWRCDGAGCDFTYELEHYVQSPPAVLDPHSSPHSGHALPLNRCAPGIAETVELTRNFRIHTYTIPECGVVRHYMANGAVNQEPGGADEMFVRLQEVDFGLRRFALKNSALSGPMLTQQFGINYGMPYKYAVSIDTKPFSTAPPELLAALQRLSWAGQSVVGEAEFVKFNELLALGYFEAQEIGYHDDGEDTLGPTIGTLSLGTRATMTLRMKATPYNGLTRAGHFDASMPILPGCAAAAERQELRRAHQELTATEFDEMVEVFRSSRTRSASPPVQLAMVLNHGDMVVMHGAKIQQYYEHAVQPQGKLRFALTCRYVKPELIPVEEHWKGVYPDDPSQHYHGE